MSYVAACRLSVVVSQPQINPPLRSFWFGAAFHILRNPFQPAPLCVYHLQATGRALASTQPSGASSSASANMGSKKVQPFGSWRSPLTAELVSGASLRLGGAAVDSDGHLLWVEGRPAESGRSVLVREATKGGFMEDITPKGFDVRTTVHEYGGGAFTIAGDTIIFSNYGDQRLYQQTLKGDRSPVALTPAYDGPVVRYADGRVDLKFNRYITVREDHRKVGKEASNEIVAIQLEGDPNTEPMILVEGNDFYSFPRISPDGEKLAWIEWSHPNMPWDSAALWVGQISVDGTVINKVCVAGGDQTIIQAPTEPCWSSKNKLLFVSDKDNGFWNLYQWVEGNNVQPLYPLDAEFTRPAWNFGNSSFSFIETDGVPSGSQVACTYRQRGISYLGILDLSTNHFSPIQTPFTTIYNLINWKNSTGKNEFSVVWSSDSIDIAKFQPYFSTPTVIQFPTKVTGQTAFANFYPPRNADFMQPEEEKPPLLVRSHGGPTSEADATLQLSIQYWTSRGWAFADVNYGGSTGYGRPYRERLYGNWGVVDVNDCCSCAEYLVATGEVDGQRLCIDGRSAGGYTTLATLVFSHTFKAGASLYGLCDLSVFQEDTHKFESHYIDSLVGKGELALRERSPINFLENLTCPVILFQGLEDKVVLPNQAEMIYKAVKAKGIPVALIEFEGEQHGFRKAENIRYTLEQEMLFFARLVGGFEVADDITPVHVDNLD
ncbi:hypothetical protein O6H91_12G091700 [Diphasiastrum complanatum]|uniref:Uncharacterized protein n=1 Tax=Diphasiastrum complanatum TaxID=34168 RepID=A0ACC2C4Q9_DIPCM|nr:hypothetical protein O6H91_12G091700 [Diphasiastrum complanatum]